MARKATDLLDVFRFSSEGSDGGGKKPPSKKTRGGGGRGKGPRKRGAGAAKRAFEGIFLNGRQLLLASSALVLLLILSFTLGLATGRPEEGAQKNALARSSELFAIRARLPVVDPATRRAVRAAQIEKRLTEDYPIKSTHLRITRDGSELVIEVGPFRSEAQAKRFIERSGLDMAHIHMENPFRYAEFVPWKTGR